MDRTKPSVGSVQYLTFFIAGEEYAVEILRTREIVEYDTVTKVPGVPACIRGVINLRGSVIPVVDLAIRFDFGQCTISKRSCIVIVEVELGGEPTIMGLLVDAIGQVIDLPPEDIAEPPAFGTNIHVDFLRGMGTAGKKFVLLLDIDLALAELELRANESLLDIDSAERSEGEEGEQDDADDENEDEPAMTAVEPRASQPARATGDEPSASEPQS